MRKIIACICTALFLSGAAFAQDSVIPQRLELVQVGEDDDEVSLEVFNMPKDGQNQYYLSVGHLGIGDEVLQINFDPLFELFIPLGNTLDEAMQKLELLKETCKADAGTTIEMDGCLALGVPNENLETVTVTSRRFLFSKLLAFSVERDGWIRASHVSRSSLNSIVASLKLYRKIHPNEE